MELTTYQKDIVSYFKTDSSYVKQLAAEIV